VSAIEDAPTRAGRLPRTARRRQLLDAALSVFVAQGYHAAAMDDIADKAGVSKPVLYQHFPGKRDLYLALLDESASALMDAVQTAMSSTNDNKARVRATVSAYYEIAEDTGLPDAEARLLGAGLAGIAQVTARSWAANGEPLPKDQAIDLVASLAWRGIRGFPRTEDHS